MISSSDPFALTFDSIRLDRTTPLPSELGPEHEPPPPIPTAEATPLALTPLLFTEQDAPVVIPPQAPGFYLLDDASGRFTIDRDTGIVTLVHDHLMALEAGAIHPVHIKVIEHSGASYDLRFRLRMTGRIPQIAGAEENDALASLAAAPLLDLMSPEERAAGTSLDRCPWTTFSSARQQSGMVQRLGSERAIYGTLLEAPPFRGYYAEQGDLALGVTLPQASAPTAAWIIEPVA